MAAYTRRHQAAERVAMRRWLAKRGVPEIVRGSEPQHTERLMRQVLHEGGDPHEIMRKARERVDRGIETCH